MQPATLKYAVSDIAPMPRAWLLLMQCVEELNNIDVTVRHRGLDGEGCEGTYGSITFRCLLKLVWDCVAHGDLPNPLLAPPPAPAAAGAGGASICVGGGLYEDQEVMARGGAAVASKPAHHGGRGAVEEGGLSLAAVPQRPGRLVDFGAGTGRALVLLQCLNLVEAAVGFEVDCTKVSKAELYMTELVAAAAAAGRRSSGAAGSSGGSAGAGAGAGSSAAGGGGGGDRPSSPQSGRLHGMPVVGGIGRGRGRGRGRSMGRGRARGRGRRGGRTGGTTTTTTTGGSDDGDDSAAAPSAAPSAGPTPPPQPQRLHVLGDLSLRPDVPAVIQADLVQLTPEALSAHSPSWGYAFWAGVPPEAQAAIWRLFMGCDTMTTLVLVGYGDRSAATLSQLMAQWDQGQGRDQGQGPHTGARRAVLRRVISNVASMGGNGCYSAFVLRKCAVAPRRTAVLVA